MESNHPRPKIILTGRTGSGKSTLGNTIANQEIFKVGNGLRSTTEGIQEEDCFIRRDSKLPVTLVDTAGSHDNRKTKKILIDTFNSIKQVQKGFNLLLHCINGLNPRFDSTDIEDIQDLSRIFTKGVVDHIYIVITHLNKVSDMDREAIIKTYKAQLAQILKDHHFTGISADRIFFFNSKANEVFIENLTEVLPKKALFRAYHNINLDDPIVALQNPETAKFFKSIIESWKEDVKCLEEFKDESSKREIQTLQVKIYLLEILTNKRGSDLKTILKSIKDQNPFCKELTHFFLSTEKDTMSVFQIAYKVLKDFDSTDKKNHWLKEDYTKALQHHLDFSFLCEVEQSLIKIINKHLESCFDKSKLDMSINTFPVLGAFAGAASAGFSSALLWTATGATEAATVVTQAAIAGATIAPEVTVATGVTAGAEVATSLGLGVATGIGLLIGLGVFTASFFCWTKEGVIEHIALAAQKSLLESYISKNLVIAALITFCDIGQ